VRRVAGGDLNDAWEVELPGGRRAFLKERKGVTPGEFAAEAAGLRWLAEPGALRMPAVLEVSDSCLVLEWVPEGRLDRAGWIALGSGLARVHAAGAPAYGSTPGGGPLHIGPIVLPAEPGDAWPAVYAQQRLAPLLRAARDRGALTGDGVRRVEEVCGRLDRLAGPPEPPARLHGDLWSGNVLAGTDGMPWLIDPAAYGGHREMDLAMLALFGSPPAAFLAAYQDVAPLADGHPERVALWQLFPLLVHAVLFGGSYGAAVERAAARY
jgi:fructosamine-3-kinase